MGAVQSCLIYNLSTVPTTIFIDSEEFRNNFPAFKKQYYAVFHFCWTKRQRMISFQYDEIFPELWNHDDDNQHLKSLRHFSFALRKTHGGNPIEWIPGSEPVVLKKEEVLDILNYISRFVDIDEEFGIYPGFSIRSQIRNLYRQQTKNLFWEQVAYPMILERTQ